MLGWERRVERNICQRDSKANTKKAAYEWQVASVFKVWQGINRDRQRRTEREIQLKARRSWAQAAAEGCLIDARTPKADTYTNNSCRRHWTKHEETAERGNSR